MRSRRLKFDFDTDLRNASGPRAGQRRKQRRRAEGKAAHFKCSAHVATLTATNARVVEVAFMTKSHDHAVHPHADDERWKHDGVRVIPGNQLDPNVPSTPGMDRKAAINFARVGAQKLWAGTVTIKPDAKTGAHHHGHLESIIYVVRGKARMRWGEHLQFTAEADPGDFIFIPPYVPHQEINASPDQVLECVLVRSDGEAIAINLDIEPVEKPQTVLWVDPIHRDGAVKS
jgi:uncharacterized RmlC-like cupin family protein